MKITNSVICLFFSWTIHDGEQILTHYSDIFHQDNKILLQGDVKHTFLSYHQ